jgi:phosphoglycerate dehydrogenase-like enzyme
MMQIWSNTTTLNGYLPPLSFTTDKTAAEVALIGGKAIDLADFPRLRGIFKTGIGRDNVPEAAAAARGIVCGFPSSRASEVIYEETASFTCHLILKVMYAAAGDFAQWTKADRPALSRRQLLVVGAGNIGGRVAARMGAFMPVATFDTLHDRPEELEPRVRAADCVALTVPLTDDTRGFFDARKLGWMKDGAGLVNTGRGALVVEDDLHRELVSGRLRAAFDVFWQEPYHGKLAGLPPDRFMVSPHIASTCREFLTETASDFRDFLAALERR